MASFQDSKGETQTISLDVDLSQAAKLDRSELPNSASAMLCLRPSIVPLPNDVRVITELGIAFGVAENGPRSLWVYVTAGRLQTMVEGGQLNADEKARLDEWIKASQRRLIEALAAANAHP